MRVALVVVLGLLGSCTNTTTQDCELSCVKCEDLKLKCDSNKNIEMENPKELGVKND